VLLCELLRYLELLLADRVDGGRPRVAVVVAAWDLLDPELRAGSCPKEWCRSAWSLLVSGRAGR